MSDERVVDWSIIQGFRHDTFNHDPLKRLRDSADAVRYVNQRGFIFFWPIAPFDVPSLWGAVAGSRPVPKTHHDPAHITWRWKDDLLGKGVWYYAKVLRQRSVLISLETLPNFYALSPNYGSPTEDYLLAYQDGNLSVEEKQVYEALLENGPLDSISLRGQARLSSANNNSRFNRALNLLMRDFRILPVGIAQAGAWKYAFIYDVVHRQFPGLVNQARPIGESQARINLLATYFNSVGASESGTIQKLFQWPSALVERTLLSMASNNTLINQVKFKDKTGDWWILSNLI